MTKEQAIEVLRCNTNLGYGIVIENESTQLIKEAIEMAIKALEQQPSEDCISRAEVQKFVSYIQSIKDSHNEENTPINYGTICDLVIRGWKLVELPSVTPTRKVGKWIKIGDRGFGYSDTVICKCSECEYKTEFTGKFSEGKLIVDMERAYKFCPNCGVDMRGTEND